MTILRKIIIVLIVFTMINCAGDQTKEHFPIATFTKPFPQRKINLWWRLGNQFSILKNGDTITYSLEFNKADRKNVIYYFSTLHATANKTYGHC